MSSLLLLIDGYNLVAPSSPPSRGNDRDWLQRQRMLLIERLANALEQPLRDRTCVVFDAARPPRNRPSEFVFQGIDVRFAVDHAEADDLLEELIRVNTAPRRLAVISSDGRVQQAANRRGCRAYHAQAWLDELLDGVVRLADGVRSATGPQPEAAEQGRGDGFPREPLQQLSEEEARGWMQRFGF